MPKSTKTRSQVTFVCRLEWVKHFGGASKRMCRRMFQKLKLPKINKLYGLDQVEHTFNVEFTMLDWVDPSLRRESAARHGGELRGSFHAIVGNLKRRSARY